MMLYLLFLGLLVLYWKCEFGAFTPGPDTICRKLHFQHSWDSSHSLKLQVHSAAVTSVGEQHSGQKNGSPWDQYLSIKMPLFKRVLVMLLALYFMFTKQHLLKLLEAAAASWLLEWCLVFFSVAGNCFECAFKQFIWNCLFCRYLLRVLQGTLFPSPVLRAKHLDRLTPEEQREAIKRWRGDCVVNCRVEFHTTSGFSSSVTGAVSEEESIASVLPTSKTLLQACSRDGLVEDTFLPDIQDESGNTNGLNSEKMEFLNSSKETNSDSFGSSNSCAKVSVCDSEGGSSAVSVA